MRGSVGPEAERRASEKAGKKIRRLWPAVQARLCTRESAELFRPGESTSEIRWPSRPEAGHRSRWFAPETAIQIGKQGLDPALRRIRFASAGCADLLTRVAPRAERIEDGGRDRIANSRAGSMHSSTVYSHDHAVGALADELQRGVARRHLEDLAADALAVHPGGWLVGVGSRTGCRCVGRRRRAWFGLRAVAVSAGQALPEVEPHFEAEIHSMHTPHERAAHGANFANFTDRRSA